MTATSPTHIPQLSAALAFALALLIAPLPAAAEPAVGEPAPAFTGTDTKGETHALAELKGKTVVLEWTNHLCPYVGKHYDTGNMQALQKEATEDGVVWLSVISSAPGKQGHVSAGKADELTESRDAHPSAVILDPEGAIGQKYGARATPHMYVINAKGTLVYKGAIDDQPSANHDTVEGARNYVRLALNAVAEGGMPETTQARAYGCSVKYAD